MAKNKMQRITGSRSFRTPKMIPLILLIFILLISAISIFLSFTVFKNHFVLSQSFLWLSMSLLSFFIAFVSFYARMDKWIEKILVPIVIMGSFAFSAAFALTSIQLFWDKPVFDAGHFKEIKGLPSAISFDGSKNAPDYVSAITINGTKIKVSHLDITEKEFRETLKSKPLKLKYLPNSKFAVSLVVEEGVQKNKAHSP
jgi:hypothetical protein